jgi:hypothetical protein
MIDATLRRELSQNLRRLVTGRMTNDEFDDAYHDKYAESADPGVRHIAEFGFSLYSSDVLLPYRLKGRHAVSCDTRRIAARCVLFLRTGLAYEWPTVPRSFLADTTAGLAFSAGLPAGIILLILGVAYLAFDGRDFGFWCRVVIIGAGMLAASVWYLIRHSNSRPLARKSQSSLGDVEAWPFLRREELCQSRRNVSRRI